MEKLLRKTDWLEIQHEASNEDEDEQELMSFVEHNGEKYYLSDFIRYDSGNEIKEFPNVCGVDVTSYFSATVIEISRCGDEARLGFLVW